MDHDQVDNNLIQVEAHAAYATSLRVGARAPPGTGTIPVLPAGLRIPYVTKGSKQASGPVKLPQYPPNPSATQMVGIEGLLRQQLNGPTIRVAYLNTAQNVGWNSLSVPRPLVRVDGPLKPNMTASIVCPNPRLAALFDSLRPREDPANAAARIPFENDRKAFAAHQRNLQGQILPSNYFLPFRTSLPAADEVKLVIQVSSQPGVPCSAIGHNIWPAGCTNPAAPLHNHLPGPIAGAKDLNLIPLFSVCRRAIKQAFDFFGELTTTGNGGPWGGLPGGNSKAILTVSYDFDSGTGHRFPIRTRVGLPFNEIEMRSITNKGIILAWDTQFGLPARAIRKGHLEDIMEVMNDLVRSRMICAERYNIDRINDVNGLVDNVAEWDREMGWFYRVHHLIFDLIPFYVAPAAMAGAGKLPVLRYKFDPFSIRSNIVDLENNGCLFKCVSKAIDFDITPLYFKLPFKERVGIMDLTVIEKAIKTTYAKKVSIYVFGSALTPLRFPLKQKDAKKVFLILQEAHYNTMSQWLGSKINSEHLSKVKLIGKYFNPQEWSNFENGKKARAKRERVLTSHAHDLMYVAMHYLNTEGNIAGANHLVTEQLIKILRTTATQNHDKTPTVIAYYGGNPFERGQKRGTANQAAVTYHILEDIQQNDLLLHPTDPDRKHSVFSPLLTIGYDLETAALRGGDMSVTYAAGFTSCKGTHVLIAQNEEDLVHPTKCVLWRMLEEMDRHAQILLQEANDAQDEVDDEDTEMNVDDEKKKKKKLETVYCYAHNGAKFDMVAVTRAIYNAGDAYSKALESNGKMISAGWRTLTFMDTCLIAASSLNAACVTFSVPAGIKGDFPHRALQNLNCWSEVITKLDTPTKVKDLPFDLWTFSSSKALRVHMPLEKLPEGKTEFESVIENPTWRRSKLLKTSKMYDWIVKNWDREVVLRDLCREYFVQDIKMVYQLALAIGQNYQEFFNINIQTRLTAGAIARALFERLLPKPIPKLTKKQYESVTSWFQGGICHSGTIMRVNKSPLWRCVSFDACSMYPAMNRGLDYMVQGKPMHHIRQYFNGFPDGQNWKIRNFGGRLMTKQDRDAFVNVSGWVRCDFKESKDANGVYINNVPILTVHVKSGVNGVDNSVLCFVRSAKNKTFFVNQLMQAFDYGVQIRLYEMEYCDTDYNNPFLPYKQFGELLEPKKQELDKMKTEAEDYPERFTQQFQDAGGKEAFFSKIEGQRAIVKVILNSLTGSHAMKIFRKQWFISTKAEDVALLYSNEEMFDKFKLGKDIPLPQLMEGANRYLHQANFINSNYEMNAATHNSLPHFSGLTWAYSKIHLNELIQCVSSPTKYGFESWEGIFLYCDTDSVYARMSPRFIKFVYEKFCYNQSPGGDEKTFGAWELETFKDFGLDGMEEFICSTMKRKCMGSRNDYKWTGAGIRESAVVEMDVWEKFESMLIGESVDFPNFQITKNQDRELLIRDGRKKLKFVSTKMRRVNPEETDPSKFEFAFWESPEEFAQEINTEMYGKSSNKRSHDSMEEGEDSYDELEDSE